MTSEDGPADGDRRGPSTGHVLDALAMGLARRTLPRGRALKLAGTALLGGAGFPAWLRGTAAAQRVLDGATGPATAASDPGCQGEAAINDRRCPENTCRGRVDCACAETTGGDKRCVAVGLERCPNRDQCDVDRDCPRGEICVKVGGCCGPWRNLCVFQCG